MFGLLELADAMDVGVQWEDFLPDGWAGAFYAAAGVVYLLRGLPRPKARSVLAHELGHAHYGHEGRSTADEWQADLFAAKQLIDPQEYLEACQEVGWNDPDELARVLGVTPHLLRVAARAARAPSGFGQWQPVKLASGLPTPPVKPDREVAPRLLTQSITIVRPRVLVPA